MTLEQWVNGLRALADLYENNPGLPRQDTRMTIYCFSGKDDEVRQSLAAAARTLGKSEKQYDENYFRLLGEIADGFPVEFVGRRSTVCRKVKVVKEVEEWDCEPILSNAAIRARLTPGSGEGEDQAEGLREAVEKQFQGR